MYVCVCDQESRYCTLQIPPVASFIAQGLQNFEHPQGTDWYSAGLDLHFMQVVGADAAGSGVLSLESIVPGL